MYRRALLGSSCKDILDYTSSLKQDREIAGEVIEVLRVHVESLMENELIPGKAGERILKELEKIKKKPDPLFHLDAEDIHEAIEIYLLKKLGRDAEYLPLGRSRNDHVAAALRLKCKKLLAEEISLLFSLREVLLSRAEEYLYVIMPAFTHLQPAQPITFAHYLCHLEEILQEYTELLLHLLRIVDKSPLGAAALGGTRVPLSREKMAEKLFAGMLKNTLSAVSSRDFLYLSGSINASLSVALSRIAEDMVVFATPQFDYILIPSEHLATSSMMPQKKNPATMEIARAWAGECMGHLISLLAIHKALSTGYNLDMQQANSHAISIFQGTIATLRIFIDFFSTLRVKEENLLRDSCLFPILVTDLAELISLKKNLPYRQVHRKVAAIVKENNTPQEIYNAIEKEFGVKITLREGIEKPVKGSPSPKDVTRYIENAKKLLEKERRELGGG